MRAVLAFLVPNCLTLARLVAGLALPWLSPDGRFIALIFAAVSDLFDGQVSRALGSTSWFGRVLDPIADKVFVLAYVVLLIVDGQLTLADALLLGLRDLAVIFGAIVPLVSGRRELYHRLAPTLLGKLATVGQFGFLVVLWLAPEQTAWVFVPTVALSGLAGLDYLRRFVQVWREADAPTPEQ